MGQQSKRFLTIFASVIKFAMEMAMSHMLMWSTWGVEIELVEEGDNIG